MRSPCTPYLALGTCLLALLALPAFAVTSAFSIPFAPHGDASRGSVAAPVPLTPTTYLCAATGPDNVFGSLDDVVLYVSHIDTTPQVDTITAPFLPNLSGRPLRLSATRVLFISAGADGVYKTADDAVILLDQIGSANLSLSIVVGGLLDADGSVPVALSSNSAVLATYGPDLLPDTADDKVALLTDIGGTNTVNYLPAPHLEDRRSRPTVLSPTSFLIPSNGLDGTKKTADDQLFLFTSVGSSNTRTDLATPHLFEFASRYPVRVSATRAVVSTCGPDGVPVTADDELLLLDGLGASNTITPIPVPFIQNFSSGTAVPLSNTTLVVSSAGPDKLHESADDELEIITGLGTTNTVTPLAMAGMDEDLSSRPVRLSPTRVAFSTGGPTFKTNTLDDEVAVVSNVGSSNSVTRIPVPGLSGAAASVILPLSTTSFLISNGGPDGKLDLGLDDQVTLVTGAGATATASSQSADGEFNAAGTSSAVQGLGGGRAVCVSSGANGTIGTGGDDQMRVVTGLPETRGMHVAKLSFTFDPAKPNAAETFSASGAYNTDDNLLHAGADLTISIGNASQTIPAARIKRKSSGVLQYSDPKHKFGFLAALTLDTGKHKFSLAGKGKGTGVRSTDAAYVPVAVDGADTYFSDRVQARAVQKGLRFP
jgi:hypothetical protein